AMPMMTGLQLIAAIRQDYPDLPVLLATGYVELPAGADQSLPRLSKPFSLEELAGAINAAMSVSRAENVTFLSQRLRQATRAQTSPGPGTSTDSA
ncbi:response regulator, partial [Jiella pacifica]